MLRLPILFFTLLLSISLATGMLDLGAFGLESPHSESSEVRQLTRFAESHMSSEWQWSISHTSDYHARSIHSAFSDMTTIFTQHYPNQPKKIADNVSDRRSFSITWPYDEMVLTVQLNELLHDQIYITVTLSGQAVRSTSATTTTIQEEQKRLSSILKQLGVTPHWHTVIEGIAAKNYESNWVSFQQDLKSFWQTNIQDAYLEEHTANVTMRTNKLNNQVRSGNKRINLQATLHRHSETDTLHLTIGSPLIKFAN